MKKWNKYYILLFSFILSLLCINIAFAQADGRYWNKEEVSSYNVLQDLKQGWGRIWYVDGKNGNDQGGDGMSLKTAWKTIGKATKHLRAGDSLLIAAGIYQERIFINKSGTEDNRILIGPQGNGEVIIDASEKVEGWTIYKGNIYKAPCPFKPTAVVMNDKPLFPEFSLNKVNEGKWYYDKKAKTIYLYAPGGRNPSTYDIGIISDDQYQDGIVINDGHYITLYGLTVRFAGGRGISILGDYNRVERCNIRFNGHTGINLFSYRNTLTNNTMIVKNHIYCNFLRNWPRGRYKWGSWGGGAVSHGTANTHYIGNVVHKNGGEGLLAYSGNGGSLFRDNIVYDNWSVNIYVDNQPDCIIERNLVFCHNPDPRDLYNNRDKTPKDNKNLRRLRADGIMTADENYSRTPPANFRNAKIINNIIIGCRRGINHYGQASGSGLKNVLVANNTIILPDAKGRGEDYIGIKVPYNRGNNINAVYRNNIVYASHPNTYLLCVNTNPKKTNDPFHGLTFSHNLWYHPTNPEPFVFGPYWHRSYKIDFKVWKMKGRCAGQVAGSVFKNPQFVNIGEYSANSVRLLPDSPAINKALPLAELGADYFGNGRNDGAPDIGAVEFIKEIAASAKTQVKTSPPKD